MNNTSIILTSSHFQLEKEPESFTDDDLKAIRIYEEQVRFLQSERERYRKILEGDWGKIHNSVRVSMNK